MIQVAPGMSSPPVYWNLSRAGGIKRLVVSTGAWGWNFSVRLREARPLKKSEVPQPLEFVYKRLTTFEDMLWPDIMVLVISDRLKAFFEKEAPGVAEYWPARIVGPGSETCPHSYWLMNITKTIDCLDRDLSMNIDADGKEFVEVEVIDGASAGPDDVLGLLKGYTVCTIIRDDLRKKMKKAAFKGPQFTRLPQSTEGMTWNKPDHSKPLPEL